MINLICANQIHFNNGKSKLPKTCSENTNNKINYQLTFTGVTLYQDFATKFKKLQISETDFIKQCMNKRPIGKGQEGYVFNIPIIGFENFVLKKTPGRNAIGELEKIQNEFPHQNYGQAIAKMGEHIRILRRQNGPTLKKLQKFTKRKSVEKTAEEYYQKLANLPQRTYNSYFKNIENLNQKDYHFDGGNSGNITLHKNKLNILDIQKDVRNNMLGECIYPFFEGFYYTNPQITGNKTIILTKLFSAAQKTNVIYGMNDFAFDFLYKKEEPSIKIELNKLLEKFLKHEKINCNKKK